MEVDLSVFRVEEKVDGDGIGVSALTVYGQNTPAAVQQKLLRLLRGDLIFLFADGSEHGFSSCSIFVLCGAFAWNAPAQMPGSSCSSIRRSCWAAILSG